MVERRPYRDFFESAYRGEDVVRVIGMRPDDIEFISPRGVPRLCFPWSSTGSFSSTGRRRNSPTGRDTGFRVSAGRGTLEKDKNADARRRELGGPLDSAGDGDGAEGLGAERRGRERDQEQRCDEPGHGRSRSWGGGEEPGAGAEPSGLP